MNFSSKWTFLMELARLAHQKWDCKFIDLKKTLSTLIGYVFVSSMIKSGGMNFICSNEKCAAPLHIWQFWVYHITEIGLQSVERPPRASYCLSTLARSCHITFHLFALTMNQLRYVKITTIVYLYWPQIKGTANRIPKLKCFFITLIKTENISHFAFH